jgi:hypothetical protein
MLGSGLLSLLMSCQVMGMYRHCDTRVLSMVHLLKTHDLLHIGGVHHRQHLSINLKSQSSQKNSIELFPIIGFNSKSHFDLLGLGPLVSPSQPDEKKRGLNLNQRLWDFEL